jgi:hypothetical protein
MGGDAGPVYSKAALERFLRTKSHLVLKYAAFDPLEAPAPPHPLAGRPDRGETATRYYIIQFKDTIRDRWRMALEEEGLRFLGFLPCNAYLADLGVFEPDQLMRFDFIRWAGPYQAAFKIDPSLVPAFSSHEDTAVRVTVTAFSTADAESFFHAPPWSEPGVIVLARLRNLRGQAAVHCELPAGPAGKKRLSRIAAVEGTAWIEPYQAAFTENDHSIWVIQSGDEVTKATPLFDNGLTGIGQVYGSVDIGVDTDACQMRYGEAAGEQTLLNDTQPPDVNITNPGNKIMTYYLLDGALPYDSHQSGYHGTHTSGCAVGDKYVDLATQDDPGHNLGDGMAPGARMVFQDAGGLGFQLPGLAAASPYDIHVQAYQSGARIHNNSYGTAAPSTNYSWIARETDQFLWEFRDYLVFFSAGNQGPGPGTLTGFGKIAKNTLAAGATRNGFQNGARDMWTDSSHGPTADFRLKPEIAAPGESIMSATETTPVGGLSTTDPPNNNCSQSRLNGTSFASATAAGGALLVRQYFTDGYYPGGERNPSDTLMPSNALIKAVMINSCINVPGQYTADNGTGGAAAPRPTNGQGWGRITLDRSLYFTGDERRLIVLEDAWNGESENQGHGPFPGRAVTTGRVYAFGIEQLPHPQKQPLMISLVWSDPAGETGSGAALVNNLDLAVFNPSGQVYAGNANFQNGFSEPAPLSESDLLNPVENIFIQYPDSGIYTVLVRGTSVPGNGTGDPFPSDLQGYALVVTGKDIVPADPVFGHHILTGAGPGASNDARVRVFDGLGDPVGPVDFLAYAAYGFGANVAAGDVNGDGADEMITGPGKDVSLPPRVRAFGPEGTALPGGEFMAYGIQKYGCVVACGDLSGDGIAEVLTGPGPGDVFGPHVRGWTYSEETFSPLAAVSFLAYGTKKFGVKPSRGDVDGDGFMEILTGPGPGAVFGPHVRGWNYDNDQVRAMSSVSFFAYGTRKWGANAAAGDIDGDGYDEILTGPGPGAVFGPHIRGWNYDNDQIQAMSGVSFFAYGTRKMGTKVAGGDIDFDGFYEILSGPGPGAMFGANVRSWQYDNDAITPGAANFFAYDSSAYRYGVNVSTVSTRGY